MIDRTLSLFEIAKQAMFNGGVIKVGIGYTSGTWDD